MAIILITGGSRGIGLAIAQVAAARLTGSTIIIGCRSLEAGEQAVRDLKALVADADYDVVPIDIEDDASILLAAQAVEKKYKKLDVLVNNAASVQLPSGQDLAAKRASANAVYNNCITSTAMVTDAFLHLLRQSEFPRVIMNSSARGSMGRTAAGELPRVALVDYCIAKAGVNMLTLHLHIAEQARPQDERVVFWAISPGHTKTAFNNFRGVKEPTDAAEAIIRLLESGKGAIASGTFWEFEQGEFRAVPW
ncbi:NAD(P)-binding protein [Thozetella sp. PMI_491]|nr:NAD(P)-binding protein [Thozetella sp. PMI_491]